MLPKLSKVQTECNKESQVISEEANGQLRPYKSTNGPSHYCVGVVVVMKVIYT
jgi:hypothetical protein